MNKVTHLSVKDFYTIRAPVYNKDNLSVHVQNLLIKKNINKISGKSILDIGCGTGTLAVYFSKKGAKVTAIDANREMLIVAKSQAKENKVKIDFLLKDASNFNLKNKFDIIIVSSVLFHISNLASAIESIVSHCHDKSIIIIANPYNTLYPSKPKSEGKRYRSKLTTGYSTNTYYHPVEKYKNLFLKRGYVLKKMENCILTKAHLKAKKSFLQVSPEYLGKPIANIMMFTKSNSSLST